MVKRIRRIKDDTYVSSLGEHIDAGDISKIRNQKKEEQSFWRGTEAENYGGVEIILFGT